MATIQELLAAQNMLGVIQSIKSGIQNPFDPALMALTRPCTGDSGTYTKLEGTRQTARAVAYGAPSVRRELKGLAVTPVKLIHSFEHQFHEPVVLQNLLQFDRPEVQRLGEQEVARQTGIFRTLFDNLRVASLASLLNLGLIYFDGDGNLLPTAGGAITSVDFQVPAGNKAQLDVFGAGALIGATWTAAGTDIVGQIQEIKAAALRLTGYPLTTAYYGADVLGWIMANTSIAALAVGNQAIAQGLLQGDIPDGLLGLNWRRVADIRYDDQNGDSQLLWPVDRVTFTPAPSRDWFEVLEGTYPIPTSLGNVTAGASEALTGIILATGMFSYAQVLNDPVTIKHLAGDTMLPVLKVPGAIFQADVNF